MKVITALEENTIDETNIGFYKKSVFLAGGITNCPIWQDVAIELLSKAKLKWLTVFNPRRKNFPIDDPNAAKEQIAWEHKYLKLTDSIIFWFPHETLCPITLFEYGKFLCKKPVFVGCSPDYGRKLDLEIQTKLEQSYIQVHNSLEKVIEEFVEFQIISRYPPG